MEKVKIIYQIIDEIIGLAKEKSKKFEKRPIIKLGNFQFLSDTGLYLPQRVVEVKEIIRPGPFLEMQINAFWTLYERVFEVIEKNISQFGLRTLLDVCYSKIIYFFKLEKKRQKEIAVKNWLCMLGFTLNRKGLPGEKKWLELYLNLIKELRKENDKKHFTRLQKSQFPIEKIVDQNKRLWHGIGSKALWDTIHKDLEIFLGANTKLAAEERESLIRGLYAWFSLLLHGDFIFLKTLETEEKADDKEHLFRSLVILLLTGVQVLKVTDKFLNIKTDETANIDKKIKENSPIIIELKRK